MLDRCSFTFPLSVFMFVRLKAPYWTDIAPKPVGTRDSSLAEKAGLGECPKKRGSPRKIELRQIIRDIISFNTRQSVGSSQKPSFYDFYYIACAVTSNNVPGPMAG